jgi:hypothetical protein
VSANDYTRHPRSGSHDRPHARVPAPRDPAASAAANSTPREPEPDRPADRRRRAGGRPRRLDDIKRSQICALLSVGCGIKTAAHYVGCSASTVRREIQRNSEFDEEVRSAFLAAELKPLNALRQAAQTHWRAAAWFLERSLPDRFAKRDPRAVTPDQLAAFTELLADVLVEEIKDPDLGRRVEKLLTKLGKTAEQAALESQIRPHVKERRRPPRNPDSLFRPDWLEDPSESQDDQHSP